MTQTCGFIYCTHTYWSACDARGDFSICRLTKWGHKYMNNIPRTARRVTSWAFDRFIWVKRSSYHIYIGYRNLKCPHGNLSKYKIGVADLREVGPPPNTKRRQNSLNRLCSVCAGLCCKKNCLCCFVFLDIKIIFIGHSEVTQPPHIVQIHPR